MIPLVQPRQPLCDEQNIYINKLLLIKNWIELLFIDLSTELKNLLHEHTTTQINTDKTNQKKPNNNNNNNCTAVPCNKELLLFTAGEKWEMFKNRNNLGP
jgi:hypothetical protein